MTGSPIKLGMTIALFGMTIAEPGRISTILLRAAAELNMLSVIMGIKGFLSGLTVFVLGMTIAELGHSAELRGASSG